MTMLVVPVPGADTAWGQPAHSNYVDTGARFANRSLPQNGLAGSRPYKLAVDPDTGNVVAVVDGQVRVFAPNDRSAAATDFGASELTTVASFASPGAVAFDQGTGALRGALYVADTSQNTITRWRSDGQPVPTYTQDPSFQASIGSFNYLVPSLAVNPATHQVIVGDLDESQVLRYSSGGQLQQTLTGTPDDPLSGPLAVSVTASTNAVTVVDGSQAEFGAESRVRRFAADGTELAELPRNLDSFSSAVDQRDGQLLLGGHVPTTSNSQDRQLQPLRLFGFVGETPAGDSDVPVNPNPTDGTSRGLIRDLALDPAGGRRLYLGVTDRSGQGGDVSVHVFRPVPAPGVETSDVSAVGSREATLNGTLTATNAGQSPVRLRVEYRRDGGSLQSTPVQTRGATAGTVPASVVVSGLRPNSTYQARLVVDYGSDESRTAGRFASFTTAKSAPDAVALPAQDVTPTTAGLAGSVTPFGVRSTYVFELGTTTDYGSVLPADRQLQAGAGFAAVGVSLPVTQLVPGTTYHFRLVATSAIGTTRSADQTFTTPAAADPARGYEQVTPVDKQNVVPSNAIGVLTSPDGSRYRYISRVSASDGQASAPLYATLLSARGSDNWASRGIDPPYDGGFSVPGSQSYSGIVESGVSPDLRYAVTRSKRQLAPGATDTGLNLYLHDLITDGYELIAPNVAQPQTIQSGLLGYTPDFGALIVADFNELQPGTPSGAFFKWTRSGGLVPQSVLPDGTVVTGYTGGQISDNGRYVPFSYTGEGAFVRIDDSRTVLMSRSRIPGDDTVDVNAGIVGFDGRTGRVAFTSVQRLTPDADLSGSNGAVALYVYDPRDDSLTYQLTAGFFIDPVLSADLRTAVYLDPLTDDQQGRIRRDGRVTAIALTREELGSRTKAIRFSPNGRFVQFATREPNVGLDPDAPNQCPESAADGPAGPCQQVYVADTTDNSVSCASCSQNGDAAAGPSSLSPIDVEGALTAQQPLRTMLDDGTAAFTTPQALTARDVNGADDVYLARGQTRQLVSSGTGLGSRLMNLSDNARDVFFHTRDRLVGQDVDDEPDIYDARIGGGLVGQQARPVADAACQRDSCQDPAAGPGPPAAPASAQPAQPVAQQPAAKPQALRATFRYRDGRVRATVTAPGRGRLRLAGTGLRTSTRSVGRAVRLTVSTRLGRKASRARARGRRVTVRPTLTFTPVFGPRSTVKATLRIGGRR